MSEKDTTFNSTKRQDRDLPLDSFGDWRWREALAELMVPIVGSMFRNGVRILMYGKSLVNENPLGIMQAHRFIRQIDGNELSESETYPILESLTKLNLSDCEIDLGELTVNYPDFAKLPEDTTSLDTYLNKELKSVIDKNEARPEIPQDIVLYGFGRVGRLVTRMLVENTGPGNYFRLRAVVVRKTNSDDLVKRASLLQRDSVHGRFSGTIRVDEANNSLVVNGNPIKFIYASGPNDFKYNEHGINNPLVIDNTGIWRDEKGLGRHINGGASKVILTAPGKDNIKNIVFGINDDELEAKDKIISAASCTTNAIVPVLKLIHDKFKITSGHVETVHAYTNDQNLIDNYHKGDRRGRSAALNMVITSTGAVKAVAKAIPELEGILTGNAIRVPTPNVSLAVMSLAINEEVTKESINNFLRESAFHSKYREIIGFVNSPEVVSTDFYSSPFASIIDSQATIAAGNRITLYCWYDNEYGYSKQVVNIAKKVSNIKLQRLPVPKDN